MPDWVLLATTTYSTALAALTFWTEQRLRGAPTLAPTPGFHAGRVALIVPARNEGHNIYRCVTSLLTQQYPAFAVIVVNDHSTDATGPLLAALQAGHERGARLHILDAPPLPAGWLGKPHACWVGAQHPAAQDADWLLFVDADTWLHPEALSGALAEANRTHSDLFSLMSAQELGSVWERLLMPHIFYGIGVSFPWQQINDPNSSLAIANGQFILIRRSVYDALGGHHTVRAAIAEDQQLAETVKRAGHRLRLVDGRGLVTTRMYTSLGEIWQGWSKNAYLGLGERGYLLWLLILGALAAGVLPFVLLPWAIRRAAQHPRWGTVSSAIQLLLLLLVILRNRWIAMRELKAPRWYAFTLPIGSLFWIALGMYAWWRIASGQGVIWKGRTYHFPKPT